MNRGAYDRAVEFVRAISVTVNDYGEQVSGGTESIQKAWARVRFGSAQEKREPAQEGGVQSATFELVPSNLLRTVTLRDQIMFEGSAWDITEIAPLERNNMRFTATRAV